jgi:LytS/YehU family sensor histidine kinase
MLENSEYEKMQRMIIAFSNHLRYVFHDNLQLVSLEAELTEVNDYYNIILLDRVTPIILNTQVDPQLNKYQVPSLLIQTFLENSVKYSKQTDKLLIFDIKINLAELEGVPVMQIHLNDNGVGYTPEMLEKLNNSENDLFAKKHVGISNLKHRIALIYKTNYQFAFYNNPSGGACVLIYLPLLEAHEE